MTRTADDVIREWKASSGPGPFSRTLGPRDDEIMVAEVLRLRADRHHMLTALIEISDLDPRPDGSAYVAISIAETAIVKSEDRRVP